MVNVTALFIEKRRIKLLIKYKKIIIIISKYKCRNVYFNK